MGGLCCRAPLYSRFPSSIAFCAKSIQSIKETKLTKMTFLSYIDREYTQYFLVDANKIPNADQFVYKHGNG